MNTATLTKELSGLNKELNQVQIEKSKEERLQQEIAAKKRALVAAQKAEKKQAAKPLVKVEAKQLKEVVRLTVELDQAVTALETTGAQLMAAGLPKANLSPYLASGLKNALTHWKNWAPELLGLPKRKR